MIKGVVFDMDGVLIDARDWHFEALNTALKIFGFEIDRKSHEAEFDGLPTKVKMEKLSSEYGFPRRLHTLINQVKQQETMKLITLNCNPVFQHQYLLSRLKDASFKIGLATNSIRTTTMRMLESAQIENYFDSIVTNEDIPNPKPHPDPYLKSALKLGLNPNEILVVEDNINGITSARAAGCKVVQVNSPLEVNWTLISANLEVI